MSYQIIHAIIGRLRVYVPRLGSDREYANQLRQRIKALEFVNDVRINLTAKSLTVSYDSNLVSHTEILEHLNTAIHKATAPKIAAHSTSALAKRLGVSSQALTWRRSQPDFAQWSQAKDLENIAWRFDPTSKSFYPVSCTEQPTQSSKIWNMMQTVAKASGSKLGGMAGRVAGEVLGLTLLGSAGLVLGAELGTFLGEEIGGLVAFGFSEAELS